MKRAYYSFILTLWALQVVAVLLTADQPLFWDNVLLTGQIPTTLWEGRLSTLFVPNEIAGYSPLWGAYIAQGWLWFGRNLFVTHLLMLPFLWGISFQLVRLAQQFVARRALGLTLAALISIPVLTALSVQCGPDLALLALYLTALNAILQRNRGWLVIVLIPLALVSPRGLWSLVPLFILDQLLVGTKLFALRWQWALGKAVAYLPAGLAVAGWYYLHYTHYGWLFNDPKGEFATLAEYTTLQEYLRQLGICIWRLIDFGQIAVWLPLAFVWIEILRGRVEEAPLRPVLALLTFVPAIAFSLFFASFRNPVGHRYMLVPMLMATLWLCYEWSEALRYPRFRARVLYVLVFFWTGHLWVALYPQDWAKGWDASLAHLQVGAAKRDVATFLMQLPPAERANVGARFPDAGSWEDAFVGEYDIHPAPYEEAENPYLLYNSASNDFDLADRAYLERYARPAVTCTYWPVVLQLWRNTRVPAARTNF